MSNSKGHRVCDFPVEGMAPRAVRCTRNANGTATGLAAGSGNPPYRERPTDPDTGADPDFNRRRRRHRPAGDRSGGSGAGRHLPHHDHPAHPRRWLCGADRVAPQAPGKTRVKPVCPPGGAGGAILPVCAVPRQRRGRAGFTHAFSGPGRAAVTIHRRQDKRQGTGGRGQRDCPVLI
jgi:hypothetical protein